MKQHHELAIILFAIVLAVMFIAAAVIIQDFTYESTVLLCMAAVIGITAAICAGLLLKTTSPRNHKH